MIDLAITEEPHETGEISAVRDCGSLVLVVLSTERGRPVPIYFERRPFGWLLEAEGMPLAALVGRRASYDGEHLRFED
jgi:hypothetical protein